MKAFVYVLKRNGNWEARMTIAPDVDHAYWFGGKRGESGAEAAWLWGEALPLGHACSVADMWIVTGKSKVKAGWLSQLSLRRKFNWLQGIWDGTLAWRGKEDGGHTHGMEKDDGTSSEDVFVLRRLEHLIVLCGDDRSRAAGGEESVMPGRGRAVYWAPETGGRLSNDTADMAKLAGSLLQGRALLSGEARALLLGAAGPGAEQSWSEAVQLASLLGQARLGGAVAAPQGRRADARGGLRCLRCGSGEARLRRTPCYACGRVCAYCEACLTMGRSRECELLIHGRYESPLEQRQTFARAGEWRTAASEEQLQRWSLSPAQQAAAAEALRFVERKLESVGREESAASVDMRHMFLLWAVTGAGKTEMIFPLVQAILDRGGRALIASPRRDVVIELDPRIRKAFPESQVVTLYGGSHQRWERGDITLATTHQLLRFYQAFELVIIDEIDAFPFANDAMLHYAANRSGMRGAPRLLLSATPPRRMQLAAKRGMLAHARVPVRYHRHPLPVPRLIRSPSVKAMLGKGQVPAILLMLLRRSLARGAQSFVFVQRIAQTAKLADLLGRDLPCEQVAATSSQDPERGEKVARFRQAEIRVLVTTTILERGVTIPRSDVYILDADGKLFDEASLVQMAGRAGRSSDDPYGQVSFFAAERNLAQLRAVRHIRGMNRAARRKGYLLADRRGGHASE